MEKNIRERPAVTLNVRLQEHRNAISKGGEREKKLVWHIISGGRRIYIILFRRKSGQKIKNIDGECRISTC